MAEVKMPITENMNAQNKYIIENGKQNGLRILTSNCLPAVKILSSVLPAIKFILIFSLFYKNKEKIITPENIILLEYLIELVCLYMDDGSLVIDSSKRKNGSIYIFTRIFILAETFIIDGKKLVFEGIIENLYLNDKNFDEIIEQCHTITKIIYDKESIDKELYI